MSDDELVADLAGYLERTAREAAVRWLTCVEHDEAEAAAMWRGYTDALGDTTATLEALVAKRKESPHD